MRTRLHWMLAVAVVLGAAIAPACVIDDEGGARGAFERTLDVPSRVRLEVRNGSGNTTIRTGPGGKVKISAEVRAGSLFGDSERRLEQVTSKPPIELAGSLLRVGPVQVNNVSITYTIEVPADAILEVHSGSGDVEASGVEGPVRLETGSGDVIAERIRQSATLSAGSGDIQVRDVEGDVDAHTGSGELRFERVGGSIRGGSGSGDLVIHEPRGRVVVRTGSGDVKVSDASADLRVNTSSGDCEVQGNPARNSVWEIGTGSGDIELDVPPSASLLLHVVGRNEVDTDLALSIEETSRRELRARLGAGEAHVRVQTSSGSVRIR